MVVGRTQLAWPHPHLTKLGQERSLSGPRGGLFEPPLEALLRAGKHACFRNRPVLAHRRDAVGKRVHRSGRADTLADNLNDLRHPDNRDILHPAQAMITRTATGQAREQRSEEKKQVQIGSFEAEGCDIVRR